MDINLRESLRDSKAIVMHVAPAKVVLTSSTSRG